MTILDRFPNLADLIRNVFGGNVEVTVTYEELLDAAEDVLLKARAIDSRCDELRGIKTQISNNWTGQSSQNIITRLEEMIENLESINAKFRRHAENLKMIAQNYVNTASGIGSMVSGLSSDVIV